MSGVMNAFRNMIGVGAQPQQFQPQDPAASAAASSASHVEANPTIPNSNTPQSDGSTGAIPAAGTGDKSPLEAYKDLFQTDPNAKAPVSATPNLNVDPAKLLEASKQLDFVKGIDPEILRKATSGDIEALSAAINAAGQQGFAHNTNVMTSVVQRALEVQAAKFKEEIIPELLRNHEARSGLRNENPVYSDPAVAPVLGMIESSLTAKFPTATPQQLKQHAQTYVDGLLQTLAGSSGYDLTKKPVQTPGSTQESAKETDWMAYMNS